MATPYLEIVAGYDVGKRFELTSDRMVLGRSGECDIPLDVAAISRKHAVVTHDGSQYFIDDLESRNHTFLNDERVMEPTPLRDGDRIQICDLTLAFVQEGSIGEVEPLADLSGFAPATETSLTGIAAEDSDDNGMSNVMATLDLSGGSVSWSMSARPEVKLAALVEITQNLSKTLSIDNLLPKILDSLFKVFVQADRAFVIMRPKQDAPLVPVAGKFRKADQEQTRISKTIVQEAMAKKKAILSADAATDSRFEMAQSIADFQIRSMMCAPMLDSNNEALGVIQIDTLNQRSKFENDDLEVLAAVAAQAAVAIENVKLHELAVTQQALERDLQLAAQMQRALLPAEAPKVPGYHFFDYYESARQVGGDYYDYVMLPGGRVAVVVGDVAGKGVAAALLMARMSSDVRFSLASVRDPAEAVTLANRSFAQHDWADRFVTMLVAVIDPATNECILVNAGHMPPMLRRANGEVVEVGEEEAGLPLGVTDDYEYEPFALTLEPGESLTIFTDGFSEAMNAQSELYGIERLRNQVASRAVGIEELGQHVLTDVRKFAGDYPQSDDMCLVCVGRSV